MIDQDGTMTGHQDGHISPNDVTRDIAQASDEELRLLIKTAGEELARRDSERKREAMAKIRMLAKEHGLNVAVDRPARKRGRPAKKE